MVREHDGIHIVLNLLEEGAGDTVSLMALAASSEAGGGDGTAMSTLPQLDEKLQTNAVFAASNLSLDPESRYEHRCLS